MGILTASGQDQKVLLKNVTLIDGTGSAAKPNVSILLEGDHISRIFPAGQLSPTGISAIDLRGKTIIPALSSTHAHVGVLKGTAVTADNYTRENILDQLKKYERYGVGSVLCMGTDRSLIFPGFSDSSREGRLSGARLYSAGHGFAVPASPPAGSWTDQLFRPYTPEQVQAEMDSLSTLHPTVVKMWVDDFAGHAEKMKPEIYQAIIRQAHQRGWRVAAHLYYLEDARRLVDAGLDIIAHSIRDQVIDDELLKKMKEKGVVYIPTLSLDEFAYIYSRKPEWLNDAFFRASLEPGVYEMISSKDYQEKVKNSPDFQRNQHGFETALKNLKKIHDAGILVSLGTDSGATPVRAQGFSEHLEMELMVEAGLTPLEAIETATKNAALVLKIDDHYGTLEPGKKADFIVLSASPEKDIRNTRKIESVWKDGKEINQGPLGGR
jgi:imidazolonepropionase-like amidohydrolase